MQIVNFCANLRKVLQLILVEEGLNCNFTLKDLQTIADHKRILPLKLTNFWYEITQRIFTISEKSFTVNSSMKPSLQNQFSRNNPEMPQIAEKHTFET